MFPLAPSAWVTATETEANDNGGAHVHGAVNNNGGAHVHGAVNGHDGANGDWRQGLSR